MIQAGRFKRLQGGHERAGLGLRSPIDHFTYACVHQRADAHEARLDRDVNRRLGQTIVPECARRIPQHQHFCMGRRIMRGNGLVERARDDVVFDDEYGANGNLARRESELRLFEGGAHVVVMCRHSV